MLLTYINTHLDEKQTLDSLYKMFRINKNQIESLFREFLNITFFLLIKANLAYAVTGDETNLDLGAIEKRIKEATKEMEEYMVSYRNTGGDKNRYLECIQSAADEIKALRVQLETAKSKLEKCDEANAEIKRLCDWLDCHDTSFADYDDIVIRRVVECIKVHRDGTITVITKFGTEATETI